VHAKNCVLVERPPSPFGASARREGTTVCRIFGCSCSLSALSSQELTTDSWQPKALLQQIVWDDPPPPLRGYGATSRRDICGAAAASKRRQARRRDPRQRNQLRWKRRRGFPVVIGEGSHPFPFRTRKLSPLPPMVLRGPTAWESRSLPGVFSMDARRLNKAAGVFFAKSWLSALGSSKTLDHSLEDLPKA
jgi:hypothetical protein